MPGAHGGLRQTVGIVKIVQGPKTLTHLRVHHRVRPDDDTHLARRPLCTSCYTSLLRRALNPTLVDFHAFTTPIVAGSLGQVPPPTRAGVSQDPPERCKHDGLDAQLPMVSVS